MEAKPVKKYPLLIYNSLTRKKEPFIPLQPGMVGMYVCGPTVYGEPHLGHARSAITFDSIFRYLTFLGYKVRYVRNITDVGHLEDELNGLGEDKILRRARTEQLEPMEVAQHYTNLYRETMRRLGVRPPSIEPVASGHIPEQIAIISRIIERGFAYVANGSVYFDVHRYAGEYPYGELSGRTVGGQLTATRELEGTDGKKNFEDFALWKKADPIHIMQWDSPWGRGFPGWHIECTAMSLKYLGLPFDIHGGGMDLKFPHHEAEIAQAKAAFGKAPVNYWIHNNMVTLEGQKMSKSKGNFISLPQLFSGEHSLLENSYDPLTVRMFILQSHHGGELDFSNKGLKAAESALERLNNYLKTLDRMEMLPLGEPDKSLDMQVEFQCDACYTAMGDDFNTAKAIAVLFTLGKALQWIGTNFTRIPLQSETWQLALHTFRGFMEHVLGIADGNSTVDVDTDLTRELLNLLADIRTKARAERNFALSDDIRDRLGKLGLTTYDIASTELTSKQENNHGNIS
ncbi:cysteine--tRNA ligase [Parapedobacter sp. ISTM3]|uniref:cysteine--tRNA ligase n=1 Tax=Parapedobacter sp. ISTM3 TaxID=2800130 RepID=UPI001903C00F|nr:cysteine--tRNA ligase [Parapedobacter sp. ISTM3]MBK1442132.1 cysteine--tRNA ligase [Parapedobacter sp. ISTM3]